MLEVSRLGREQLLGHHRLLARKDTVRAARHGGGGGAQLLAYHRTGEDGALVLERDAGDLPLPRVPAWDQAPSRPPGRGLSVRVGCRSGCRWSRPNRRNTGPAGPCSRRLGSTTAMIGIFRS
ncbi:hypothetical protein B591_30313 (plasmid) [Streptomyces sp. GBA 94-10 4N24]|nr:hypothetical protein B591_30313 [Streptomyces sp. GBA 94-10 4N24]UZN63046.1 hypothetical protein B591N_30313 [Streptomyces sp. GBA 94-10 4N24]